MKMKRVATMLLAACLMVPGLGGATEAAASKGKILVVASSQDKMELANHTMMDVGFYLNEFAVPTEYLADRGYQIVLATPSGKLPDMDKSSNNKNFFGGDDAARAKAVKFVESLKPITLKKALKNKDQYAAVFIPGGHAPMTDLMQDPELGAILRDAHEKQKPTAFICHGPVAALAALPQAAEYRKALVAGDLKAAQAASQDWIYKGYAMTCLSDAEEWPGEVAKGTQMPFHVEQALQIAGGRMQEETMYGSHVVQDRELITGQNPASDIALAQALDKALEK